MATSTTITTPATPATTVKVQIRKEHGQWTIEAEDHLENDKRFKDIEKVFKEKREARHQKKEPDHTPIVFNEGDTLTFTCSDDSLEFAIGAKKDDVVDAIAGTPDDPFGWNELRTLAAGGSVSGDVMKSSGVKEQAFYKFHGWVMENGRRQDVDPDGYCGS